ncbi:MAG: Gfo/Idh/MocA family oxidoreductase [bacterium]|jgi:predicted dehydrogenase|nr:Gfo/Idh/MocA family oxidoreductase [bacterium]
MSLRIGLVGTGAFAQHFITLFKAHPGVEQVILCDIDTEKLRSNAEKHGIAETSSSLDHLCTTGVDAVALFTQNWLHGPQAVQALLAGKHVYSAVPAGIALEEIQALVRTVAQTGKIYMIGETSYYYPSVVYCRQRFAQNAFGKMVYAEGEYYHDWDHGLYDVAKWRGGEAWRDTAGVPPMYYPTHSTSTIVSVTGAHMTQVSCQGFVDDHADGIYAPGTNQWQNRFSNESALFRMSDGSSARINEFRRIGHPGTVRMTMFGTEGSFEHNHAGATWLTKDRQAVQKLDELLTCRRESQRVVSDMDKVTADDGTHHSAAPIHDVHRLPAEFKHLPNGHNGSHQFLVDDFVRACITGKTPPNNAWDAARYVIPGLIAHDSALQNGTLLPIPDLGPAPGDNGLEIGAT